MAARIDAAADILVSGGAAFSVDTRTFTLMGWYYMVANRSATGVLMQIDDSGANYKQISLAADGVSIVIAGSSGFGSVDSGSDFSVGAWTHVALVCVAGSPNSSSLYINGSLITMQTDASGAVGLSRCFFGSNGAAWFSGRMQYLRFWSTNLTGTEINTEKASLQYAVKATGLVSDWPLFPTNRTTDFGSSRTMTEGGTITDEAGPTMTVTPTGVASLQAFGTSKLNRFLSPLGVASLQALGTPLLQRILSPSGIASLQAFGTSKLNRFISPSGVASSQAFGTTVMGMYYDPDTIASAEAFGTAIVRINQFISPSGIASLQVFGVAQLNRFLSPSGVASLQAFGAVTLGMYYDPDTIASAEAFGSAQFNRFIAAIGIASLQAFGTAFLNIQQRILPSGIVSAQAFGVLTLGMYYDPDTIASAEAFGTAQLSRFLRPLGIASLQALGIPNLTRLIGPSGILSQQAFGTLILSMFYHPDTIPSAEVVPLPLVYFPGYITGDILASEMFSVSVDMTSEDDTIQLTGTRDIKLVIRSTGKGNASHIDTGKQEIVLRQN